LPVETTIILFSGVFFNGIIPHRLTANMKLPNLMVIALAAMVSLTAGVTSSRAQQMRTSLEDLASISEAVVVAKTVKTESFWNDEHTAILTRVTLQVSEYLSGQSARETDVIIPGGQVGNIIQEVSDMPFFLPDEEAIVFVEKHSSGIHVIAGGILGKLPISEDRQTGVKMVSGSGLILMEAEPNSESEKDLEANVELDIFKRRFKERIK